MEALDGREILTIAYFVKFAYFKKILLIYFLERGDERVKEGEKHQCAIACYMPPAVQPGTALTGSQTCDPLVRRPGLNPLSHSSQGDFFVKVLLFVPHLQ